MYVSGSLCGSVWGLPARPCCAQHAHTWFMKWSLLVPWSPFCSSLSGAYHSQCFEPSCPPFPPPHPSPPLPIPSPPLPSLVFLLSWNVKQQHFFFSVFPCTGVQGSRSSNLPSGKGLPCPLPGELFHIVELSNSIGWWWQVPRGIRHLLLIPMCQLFDLFYS